VTCSRIREAYRRFVKDMWRKLFKGSEGYPEDNVTETTAFWRVLRYLEQTNLHRVVRENISMN
jgi:hypothetical protein